MYIYIDKVNKLIDEMLTNFNIKQKSIAFYKGRIGNFFNDVIIKNKPLDALTYFDIDTFLGKLNCSNAEKLNVYNALKRFFEYTYLIGETKEIMSQVKKPISERKIPEVLSEDGYLKLKEYIVNKDNLIKDRLILGLFLFTGLSRKYIANLRNSDFKFQGGVYKLAIWKEEEEIELPIKSELQLIINEYCNTLIETEKFMKVIKIDENHISSYIKGICKPIISEECTPTILSNTFIAKALSGGNYVYEISNLTLESLSTIEKHIKEEDNLNNKQMSILNSF